MKYETPELTALNSAVNSIQGTKEGPNGIDNDRTEFGVGAYEDWE